MSLTVAILTFLAVTFLGLLAYWKEFEKTKRKFSPFQIVVLISLAIVIALGVWNEINKSIDAKKDKVEMVDSTKKEGVNIRKTVISRGDKTDNKLDLGFVKTGNKLDSGFNASGKKIRKIPIPFALLDFSVGERNPFLDKSKKGDGFIFVVKLTNWGSGFAYNINGTIHIIDRGQNGLYLANTPRKSAINRRIAIPPDKSFHAPFTKDFDNVKMGTDSAFFCVKFDFTDSTKRNKSIYRVFYIDKDLTLNNAIDSDEEMVEDFLVKNKYWKPPFRQ